MPGPRLAPLEILQRLQDLTSIVNDDNKPKVRDEVEALRQATPLDWRDGDILEIARSEAEAFVAHPPDNDELRRAMDYIRDHWQRRYGLVQVG